MKWVNFAEHEQRVPESRAQKAADGRTISVILDEIDKM